MKALASTNRSPSIGMRKSALTIRPPRPNKCYPAQHEVIVLGGQPLNQREGLGACWAYSRDAPGGKSAVAPPNVSPVRRPPPAPHRARLHRAHRDRGRLRWAGYCALGVDGYAREVGRILQGSKDPPTTANARAEVDTAVGTVRKAEVYHKRGGHADIHNAWVHGLLQWRDACWRFVRAQATPVLEQLLFM